MRVARPAAAGLVVFAVAFPVALAFFLQSPVLHDTDSYYHLAVAREIGEQRKLPERLEWARFSLLHDPFPDKELLFHLALTPFVGMNEPQSTLGGRIALALLAALLLGTLAALAWESAGAWAAGLSLLLPVLALDFTDRLVRLRPELLALWLLLLAVHAAARGRDRTTGFLGFLFALSYVAFHAFLGLILLIALYQGIAQRENRLRLALYTALGVGLGLVVHPAFPANLELWSAANVHLFRHVETLGAGGAELQPATTRAVLAKNFGFLATLALILAAWKARRGPVAEPRLAGAYGVAAVAFTLLYLSMWRFAIYAIPFLLLATLSIVGRLPFERIGESQRFSWLHAGLLLTLVLSLPPASGMASELLELGKPPVDREAAWRDFGRILPPGARVAAPWGIAQAYVFFAPQGRYLNLLDPVLLALPYPDLSRLERSVFSGEEPDLALAVFHGLGSDYLAFSQLSSPPRLLERAGGDPRLVLLTRGPDRLYRIEAAGASEFVRSGFLARTLRETDLRPYPTLPPGRGGDIEAFLDASRVGRGCVRFERTETFRERERHRLEFSPYGPGALFVDGRLVLATRSSLGAVPGHGIRFETDFEPGPRTIALEVCPDPATGRNGFFLRRQAAPASHP